MSDYEWIGASTGVADGGSLSIGLWGPTDTSDWANIAINAYDTLGATTDKQSLGYFLRTLVDLEFSLASTENNTAVIRWAVRWVNDVRLFDENEVDPIDSGVLSSDNILAFGQEQVSTDGNTFLTVGTSGMEVDVSSTRQVNDESGLVMIFDGPAGVVNYNLLSRTLAGENAS